MSLKSLKSLSVIANLNIKVEADAFKEIENYNSSYQTKPNQTKPNKTKQNKTKLN